MVQYYIGIVLDIQWIKDNYCGSIVLQDNKFINNMVDVDDRYGFFTTYGSLLYSQIHEQMEFNMFIQNCNFKKHFSTVMFISKADIPIPIIPTPIFGNNTIFANDTIFFGNDTLNGNMTSNSSIPFTHTQIHQLF